MREYRSVPAVGLDSLCQAIVRLGEAFLYSDVLASRTPDLDAARSARGGTGAQPDLGRQGNTRRKRGVVAQYGLRYRDGSDRRRNPAPRAGGGHRGEGVRLPLSPRTLPHPGEQGVAVPRR
ncbi:QsdR family transcriptional regulator [Amycolatopsis coloradensis]|uniref:QsdR family transcriptional regulator n=1 Tax=Amycolatopsis coloradensis TaxID=76021 RepID=UPI001FC97376|nr:QsdR family transcriptional regulator [Amycolatopsis coloradensis]